MKLVGAMTLEQKIAQLHGAMQTIDIYALTAEAAESGADMDQLAAQIRIDRHVTAIEELGIPVDAPDGVNAPVTVTGSVTNTGPVAGAEVVQVYLGVPGEGQLPKRLVGFQKVFVEAGKSQPMRITIDPAATNHPFGVWDYCTQGFVTKPGTYTVYVGNSADNTSHTTTLTLS